MNQTSDAALIQAFQAKDASAFSALVDRYQGRLLRYARFLPGGADEAEDVVQEVFLRLARTPPALPVETESDRPESRSRLASWLFRVTRNCAMERIRSDSRRRLREQSVAMLEASEGGQRAVEANDTRRAVERGLGRLKQDQREVLVLRLLEDRSYREIAVITGKQMGTVAWLISEGLRALSRSLAPLATESIHPTHRVQELKGESP